MVGVAPRGKGQPDVGCMGPVLPATDGNRPPIWCTRERTSIPPPCQGRGMFPRRMKGKFCVGNGKAVSCDLALRTVRRLDSPFG